MKKPKTLVSILSEVTGAALVGAFMGHVDAQPLWWGWLVMAAGGVIAAAMVKTADWRLKIKLIPPSIIVGIAVTLGIICVVENVTHNDAPNIGFLLMMIGIAAVFGAIVGVIDSGAPPAPAPSSGDQA